MTKPFVAILMGSDSDLPQVQTTIDTLKKLGITVEARVTSAHRTPARTQEYVKSAEERGCQVFICAAGLAAHLAGAVAAYTVRPVIGIPVETGPLQGHDALLSTVMMPGGIPVATVAIGKAGAKNAAYLAAQIMAISNPALYEVLKKDRQDNADAVAEKDQRLQDTLAL